MHKEFEINIVMTDIDATLIRTNIMMQEFAEWFLNKQARTFFLPRMSGAITWVDAKDVAMAIMNIITATSPVPSEITLTGSASLSCEEVVKQFSSVIQMPFSSAIISEEKLRRKMMETLNIDESQAINMIDAFKFAVEKERGAFVTKDFKQLTMVDPSTFEDYIARDREVFEGKFKYTIAVIGSHRYICPILFEKLFCKGFKTYNAIFSPLDREYQNTVYSLANAEEPATQKKARKASININSLLGYATKMRKFMKGAAKMLMFMPFSSYMTDFKLSDELLRKTLDICEEQGVKHIVLVADFGFVVKNQIYVKYALDYIVDKKIHYTLLAVNYTFQMISQLVGMYMQLLISLDYQLQTSNVFAVSHEKQNVKMSLVNAEDVALAIEQVLIDNSGKFTNKTFRVTGPKSLSFDDIAAVVRAI